MSHLQREEAHKQTDPFRSLKKEERIVAHWDSFEFCRMYHIGLVHLTIYGAHWDTFEFCRI